jgi:hypothetical protein
MASIRARLDRIKEDPGRLIDSEAVEEACLAAGRRHRRRTLDPATTLRVFAAQVAHGNTAISHVVRLAGGAFSESAYCQARARLPVAAVRAALSASIARARGEREASDGLWHGHRTGLIDGTGVSVPDTPALRAWFGARNGDGAGLPLAHTLTLFDAHDGLLLDLHTSPAYTQDLRHARELHPALRPGDVLVGDRGFASYVHLHRLAGIGCHGVFRVSASWKIPFPARSGERGTNAYNRHPRREPVLIRTFGQDDQVIEIAKPHNRHKHMTAEEFAALPATMTVRVLRYKTQGKGLRTREITLITTLIDAEKYPAEDLAALYAMRWRIEVNLRHLKRTMGMDRIKCQSVEGVERELLMFAMVYNAVCRVRARSARASGIAPTRLSFVDSLRALLLTDSATPDETSDPPHIKAWPIREQRTHPRALKRKHSDFRVMRRSRAAIVARIIHREMAN